MFKNSNGKYVGFESSWKTERTVVENGIQTASVSSENSSSQTVERINIGVQTDPDNKKQIMDTDIDYNSLLSFLQRVTPTILKNLEKNAHSQALNNYKLLSDNETSETEIQYTLTHKPLSAEFQCLDISWNSTGNVLAACYGIPIHDDWCNHESVITTWNLQLKDFNSNKANVVIETDCCMTAIAFHPEIPAIFAAGKFNGEVAVWNIAKEDDMLVADLAAHRELITGLHWIRSENQMDYWLVSCSLDGQILIWKINEDSRTLVSIKRFVVLVEHLPRNLKIKSRRRNAEVGITSLSFNSEDESIFIIGTEGGGIFQCSMNSQVPANYSSSDSSYISPIVISFESHFGHVESIHCSPHSRNAFLSCSSDSEIRIYTLLQAKPVLVLKSLAGFARAEWSPLRPLIIAAVTKDGQVVIYNLKTNISVPIYTFDLSKGSGGYRLHFNEHNSHLLTTTTNSSIQVWKLGTDIISASEEEKDELNKLISETID